MGIKVLHVTSLKFGATGCLHYSIENYEVGMKEYRKKVGQGLGCTGFNISSSAWTTDNSLKDKREEYDHRLACLLNSRDSYPPICVSCYRPVLSALTQNILTIVGLNNFVID